MMEQWTIPFPAPDGEEPRTVYIYLPESYQYQKRRRYPVLYMFDGHNLFFDEDATYGKCWGLKTYMDHTHMPLIIVGIDCNHSPDHGRLKEYSPFTFEDKSVGRISGRGRTTMEWIVHTLKPEIDTRYRTLRSRDHTFIAGSSMGGLMSLYALIKYNRFFSRAAALSPSIWVAADKLEQLIQTSSLHANTHLYMDYGSLEFSNHDQMEPQFAQIAMALLQRHVYLNCRVIPGGTHCESSWERQLPFFMNTLLYRS